MKSITFADRLRRRLGWLVLAVLCCLWGPVWGQDAGSGNASSPIDSVTTMETVADSVVSQAPADTLKELTDALALLRDMSAAMDSLLVFEQRLYAATEEQRQLLRVQAEKEVKTVQEAPDKLLGLIVKLERKNASVDSIRTRFKTFMFEKMDIYERSFDYWTHELNELRSQRGVSAVEELGDLEVRIEQTRDKLDGIYTGMFATLDVADSLRIETTKAWHDVDRLLLTNADDLASRLQIAVAQRNKLSERVHDEERAGAPESDIGSDRIQLRYAERRVQGLARSLDAAVGLLDKRGFDTTDYRRQAIRSTGKITQDILNPRVLIGLVSDFATGIGLWLKKNLPTVLVRLLIVIAFVVLFRFLFQTIWWVLRTMRVVRLPRLSMALVDGLVKPVGSTTGLVLGLWFLGVNAATMLAGLGVAGVIVGLALQDSLANLAAGFFILVTRPYDVDDIVQSGAAAGTVKKMGLANTTIRTFDGRRLLIPNRLIWGNIIENRSAELVRRVEITVRVAYEEDINQVLQLLRAVVQDDERFLKSPEPDIFVLGLDESWMTVAVRPWTKTTNWWTLLTQLPRMVRLRFAEAGIEIPYPKADIAIAGNRNPYDVTEAKDPKPKAASPSKPDLT